MWIFNQQHFLCDAYKQIKPCPWFATQTQEAGKEETLGKSLCV